MEARRELYYFLSWLYLEGPSKELVGDLIRGEFQLECRNGRMDEGFKILKEWAAAVEGEEDGYLSAQNEYAKLFIGIGKPLVSPYQSVYEEGAPYSRATLRVKETYSQAGTSKAKQVKEPEDHIGVELAFMGSMCSRVSSLASEKEVMENLHTQRYFLNELLKWAPEFCEKIIGIGGSRFFRGVALLTLGFMEEERHTVERLIAAYELDKHRF